MTNNGRKRAIVVEKNGWPITAPRDFMNMLECRWNHDCYIVDSLVRCIVRIHLLNGAVMLSEAKHLWLISVGGDPEIIRDSSLRSE
jgi:hypothetical protein